MIAFGKAVTVPLVFAFCFCCYVVSAREETATAVAPYFVDVPAEDRAVYDAWWTERGSQLYPNNVFLPMVTEPTNGAAVYWRFTSTPNGGGSTNDDGTAIGRDGSVGVSEPEATHIQFAVAVRAEGWVGLGISEAGKSDVGRWYY